MFTFVMKFYAIGNDSSFLSTAVVIAENRESAVKNLEDKMSEFVEHGISIVKVDFVDDEGVYLLGV